MDLTEINIPTPQEIDAAIDAAHRMRANALRGWVQTAAHWLAHPHFGHRTA